VLLESWPLEASLWDGEVLAGPVPSLFSEDIKSSEDALIGNITQRICQKIRFIFPLLQGQEQPKIIFFEYINPMTLSIHFDLIDFSGWACT